MNSADDVSSDEPSPEAESTRFLRGVRHILAPMDLAQNSLRTIAYAIRLGQHFGSRLTLLHVYQPPIGFVLTQGVLEAAVSGDRRRSKLHARVRSGS